MYKYIICMQYSVIFMVCLPQLLFGYIDTGSFYAFFQLILATAVGAIVMFKNYIYLFLRKLFKNKK